MESQKDTTLKDTQASVNQLDTRSLAIFQNDSDFYVAHKKAEKLAVATYMISNFFTPEEPLKWSLRKVATELVKDTVALSSASLALKDSLLRTLVAKIVELSSLYEIAHKAGFISPMNSSVIVFELDKMLKLLDKREGTHVGTKSVAFNEAFFSVPKVKEDEVFPGKTPVWSQAPAQKFTQNIQTAESTPTTHFHSDGNRSHQVSESSKSPLSLIKDNQNQKDIKDKRQNIIIALIKKHRTLTIKGFTSVINDCSEKTIQRELLALVAKGVLKKEGERRWSTYSLA